ncbi:hypothetical protein [Pyruvatibacter mobilis]|jgi:hypothetical protein|uniref:Uncharacterized protein n=1 Tax=Pyruvatibacter mobilis TaxID=1712261 RepID=A0A845QE65_9HYPH|nr:hypothetical protein [Pyruvatibacter mobilis]NBG96842.1 hypothetical protein [Pyruvatibacter mobilis]QJD74776.1 hypothetical protein HG718_04745 [Pyruvatibacter mobilis]GGD10025.1 hypothetical protein GCM10011587_12400 [Pyruvatibacter mobilis]
MDFIWLIGGGIALAIVISLVMFGSGHKRARKDERLGQAFDRARYARRTGTMGSDRGYIR